MGTGGRGRDIGGIAVAAMVLAVACGSTAPADPAPATASAFCAEVTRRSAAFSARCQGGSEADWRAWSDTFGLCSTLDRLVAGGTIRYHRDRAAACLDAQRPDRDCFADVGACYYETIEGLVPEGAACRDSYECSPFATCLAAGFVSNACEPRTCVVFPAHPGDTCRDLPVCVGDLTCVQGVCLANLADGAPCFGPDLPACGAGLSCDTAMNACAPRRASGSCLDDHDCLPTHFCLAGACTARRAVGAACADKPTGCVAFASCSPTTGLCQPAGHAGQVCATYDGADPYVCTTGPCQTAMDGTTSCTARQPLGASCFTGDECSSGGCGAAGVCSTCGP